MSSKESYLNAIHMAERIQEDPSIVSKDTSSPEGLGGLRKVRNEVVDDNSVLNQVLKDASSMNLLKEEMKNFKEETSKKETQPSKLDGINQETVDFVAGFEKFSGNAYSDFKQTSIGYGSKASSKNQTITEDEAKKLLIKDLNTARKFVVRMKEKAGYSWSESQIDALTSFTHNNGPTGLNKLTEFGTRGDEEISNMIPEYKYAGGKVRQGLVKRRAAELKLFNEGLYE
jgi:GH24 family phage-related lysozyme (muramidase)